MNKKCFIAALATLVLILSIPSKSYAKCPSGNFEIIKMLGDVCWECMLPLKIAGITVLNGPMKNKPSLSGLNRPICLCPMPPPIFQRIGIPVGFFEASRIGEVVSEAYCFPMFGFQLANPSGGTLDGTFGTTSKGAKKTFMQVHWYSFPIYAIIEMMTDFICLESTGFDLAYLTEVDPLWQDDMLTALINPEALLFGNPISNLACMADATASNLTGKSLDPLFWCKGSWGNAYPLTGNTQTKSIAEDSASILASFMYKLHRQMILWNSFGPGTLLCTKWPSPIWFKNAYRLQIMYPKSNSKAIVIGESGLKWGAGKNPPMKGDNYGWLVFKVRECCAF